MVMKNRWLLPEGIEEILPPEAARLEDLCRRIIDLYKSWGYQLVIPPLIEFLDSLLTGTGEDLDLQTFKITDQLSGRLMGVRADTTPQVARMDARNLRRSAPARLCYLGTVLHTRPLIHGGSRSPLQAGVELYGHQGRESDAEILCLMLETLKLAEIPSVHIDLGHVGIFQGLADQARLSREQEIGMFNVLQRKATAELQEMIHAWSLPEKIGNMLLYLISANGDSSIFREAEKQLASASAPVKRCLRELQAVAGLVRKRLPDAPLHFDLAELRGYHYHTGVVFAAYVPGTGQGIAFGGRYDDIGSAFGRARSATGFSTDIKTLLALSTAPLRERPGIFAPCKDAPGLLKLIKQLRRKGEVVISDLPGQKGNAKELGCDRKLVLRNGQWKVVKL